MRIMYGCNTCFFLPAAPLLIIALALCVISIEISARRSFEGLSLSAPAAPRPDSARAGCPGANVAHGSQTSSRPGAFEKRSSENVFNIPITSSKRLGDRVCHIILQLHVQLSTIIEQFSDRRKIPSV